MVLWCLRRIRSTPVYLRVSTENLEFVYDLTFTANISDRNVIIFISDFLIKIIIIIIIIYNINCKIHYF
jgi:hypothetical protein